MRISDWSSDVCSSDLLAYGHLALAAMLKAGHNNLIWTTNFDHLLADASAKTFGTTRNLTVVGLDGTSLAGQQIASQSWPIEVKLHGDFRSQHLKNTAAELRSEEHTSELQSLMRISYAVFCLNKKKT